MQNNFEMAFEMLIKLYYMVWMQYCIHNIFNGKVFTMFLENNSKILMGNQNGSMIMDPEMGLP